MVKMSPPLTSLTSTHTLSTELFFDVKLATSYSPELFLWFYSTYTLFLNLHSVNK